MKKTIILTLCIVGFFVGCGRPLPREEAESIAIKKWSELVKTLNLDASEFSMKPPEDQDGNRNWIFIWKKNKTSDYAVYIGVGPNRLAEWTVDNKATQRVTR